MSKSKRIGVQPRKPGTCGAIITRGGRKFPCMHPRDHQCGHLIYTKTSGNIFVALTTVALAVAFALTAGGCSDGNFDVGGGVESDVTEAESGIGTGRDDGREDSPVGDAGGDAESSADSGAIDSGVIDSGAVDSVVVDSGAVDSGAVDSGAVDSGAVDSGKIDSGASDTGADTALDTGTDTKPPPGTFACTPVGAETWFCSMGSHCCMHPDYYGTCASGGSCPSGVPFIECNTNGDCVGGSKVCCAEGPSRVCRAACGG